MKISQEIPSLCQFPSFILFAVGPHLGLQGGDFIAYKTINVQRIQRDAVHHHSVDTEPKRFLFWILFGVMNYSFLSTPVIGEVKLWCAFALTDSYGEFIYI